jgi:hypothetical protein
VAGDEAGVTSPGPPARIHVIGGGGSGKTTLARRVADVLGAPHVELDLGADIDEVAGRPAWVTEGIFVFGVEPLLAAADVIVWLDLRWRTARNRIVRRHARLSLTGRNRHRGLRLLRTFLAGQRRYYTAPAREPRGPTDFDAITRAATERLLAPHASKLVHLTRPAQVREWARVVSAR